MEDVFKTSNLFDDNGIFRGYTTMIELYNALKFITVLFFYSKDIWFNLGVAFLKPVSIFQNHFSFKQIVSDGMILLDNASQSVYLLTSGRSGIYMSLVVRKPVFGVSDQVPHKPSCTTTQDG